MASLTPQDAAIVELREAGLCARDIAREMNLSMVTVNRALAANGSCGWNTRHRASMVRGTRDLLVAIKRERTR